MAKSHKTCMEQAEIIDTFGTYHLLDGLGRSPVKNSLDMFWGDGNAILGNHMSKVGYFRKPEFTLGILGIEFVFSKLRQYQTKMFSMLFLHSWSISIYHPDKP